MAAEQAKASPWLKMDDTGKIKKIDEEKQGVRLRCQWPSGLTRIIFEVLPARLGDVAAKPCTTPQPC